MTPGGHRYGENRLARMQRNNMPPYSRARHRSRSELAESDRGLIALAIEQGECTADPIRASSRIVGSSPQVTDVEATQIALYREHM